MEIISVNLGRAEVLDPARPGKRTGINKRPVDGPVHIGANGLEGDAVVETRHHGGPDQALYLYGEPDYAYWRAAGIETAPGLFGENLTVAGMESAVLCVGDRLTAGEVVMEITSPRIPCATFAKKMGDPRFAKRFSRAGRPGAYVRVLSPGRMAPGDRVSLEAYTGDRLSLGEFFAIALDERSASRETLERLLALPIAERARRDYEALAPR